MISATQDVHPIVSGGLLQGIIDGLHDRPGETAARRDARSRDIVATVAGFAPRDRVELMFAGIVVLHAHLIEDAARHLTRQQDERQKARATSAVVALDRHMIGFLRELRAARKRSLVSAAVTRTQADPPMADAAPRDAAPPDAGTAAAAPPDAAPPDAGTAAAVPRDAAPPAAAPPAAAASPAVPPVAHGVRTAPSDAPPARPIRDSGVSIAAMLAVTSPPGAPLTVHRTGTRPPPAPAPWPPNDVRGPCPQSGTALPDHPEAPPLASITGPVVATERRSAENPAVPADF